MSFTSLAHSTLKFYTIIRFSLFIKIART